MEDDNEIEKALIDSFQRLTSASRGVKFSLVVTCIAEILYIISFSTSGWSLKGQSRFGLWTFCNSSSKYECCKSSELLIEDTDWLHNARVFMSFGLVFGFAKAISITMFSCIIESPRRKKHARIFTFITSFSIALVTIIGTSIYGTQYSKEPLLATFAPSGSFVVSIISGMLFFTSGIVLLFESDNQVQNLNEGTGQNLPSTMTNRESNSGLQHNTSSNSPAFGNNSDLGSYLRSGTIIGDYLVSRENTFDHSVFSLPISPRPETSNPQQISQRQEQGNGGQTVLPGTVTNSTDTCCVCYERSINIVLLPCRHNTLCNVCCDQLPEPKQCPNCRGDVREVVVTYR